VTIATDSGGRQRTHTDGLLQATRAAALAARAATWLRDEEANASGENVAGRSLTELPLMLNVKRRRHDGNRMNAAAVVTI
jgi:hypothetical protein